MDIAVFGIGPSGLAAGWAALRAGHKVRFYADTTAKSNLYGCQYLQSEIPIAPDVKIPHVRVSQILVGTPQQYRDKVYGTSWGGEIADMQREHDAWDIRATYDELFARISKSSKVQLVMTQIDHGWVGRNSRDLSRFAHVISTIPAMALCGNPCQHPSQSGHYFASHKIKAIGAVSPYDYDGNDYVKCDGTDKELYFRSSRVFGYRTVEWPNSVRLATLPAGTVTVARPLSADCDCHPEIIRLGRYGAWRKGVLVHHVFADAERVVRGEWV